MARCKNEKGVARGKQAGLANTGRVVKRKPKKAQRVKAAQERRQVAQTSSNGNYWAVRKGRVPGVYTTSERYHDQVDGFSGAESKKFLTAKEAVEFLGEEFGYVEEPPEKPVYATHSLVKYDKIPLPRGFALGCVRSFGKTVLPTVAQPCFLVSQATPNSSKSQLPQHQIISENLDPGARASQLASENIREPAEDDLVDNANHTENGTNTDDSTEEEEDDDQETVGLLDGEFVALISDEDAPNSRPGVSASGGEGAGAVEEVAVTKTEWEEWELPWHDANQRISSQSLRLHNEIVELTTLLRPTEKEDAQRREAHQLLLDVVQESFPGSTLEIFGSFATGLHLPTSDVDCVILGSSIPESQVGQALVGLGRTLMKKDWVTDLEVVSKAKVPIVKLVVMPFGLKFDISIGRGNGLDAVTVIKDALVQWPALRPLVTIIKLFLLQRQLNEVYTGGLSSYSLIISAIALLQMHSSRLRPIQDGTAPRGKAGHLDQNLGLLLMDYFRFYGRGLKYQTVGVSCAQMGQCYNREHEGFARNPRDRGDRYSFMDPLDFSNDVSRGSFNSHLIRSSFDHAYSVLTIPGASRSKSLLSSILRLNDVLAIRPPPVRSPPLAKHLRFSDGGSKVNVKNGGPRKRSRGTSGGEDRKRQR